MLRLKDVADIEFGTESYSFHSELSEHPGVSFMVMQTAGSNANEIIENIEALVDEIRPTLPAGLVIDDVMNTNDFLDASIANVV